MGEGKGEMQLQCYISCGSFLLILTSALDLPLLFPSLSHQLDFEDDDEEDEPAASVEKSKGLEADESKNNAITA